MTETSTPAAPVAAASAAVDEALEEFNLGTVVVGLLCIVGLLAAVLVLERVLEYTSMHSHTQDQEEE